MNRILSFKRLTLILTIIGVVIPIWIWQSELNSSSLQFKIVSQVSLQPDTANSISGLHVEVDGMQLKSPYLTVLTLSNNGVKAIPSNFYEAPLEIRIAEGAVLARSQVTETSPKDITAEITSGTQSIKLMPLLLNPKDKITISVLTSGAKPEFTTRARIAGISVVPIDDSVAKQSTVTKTILLFIISFALLFSSDLTGSGSAKEPLILRRRAAFFVSLTTGFLGGALFYSFLELVGITSLWQVILAFICILLASIITSAFWNKNARSGISVK